MWVLRTIAMAVALFLTACAGVNPDNDRTTQWEGAPMVNVIAKLGPPDQIIHLPGGHTVYAYNTYQDNTFNAPQPTNTQVIVAPHGKTIGIPIPGNLPPKSADRCNATFETNAKNIVVKTTSKGSCVALMNLSAFPQ